VFSRIKSKQPLKSFGPTLLDLRVGLEGVLVFDEGFNKGIDGTNSTDDDGVEGATVIGVAAGGLAFMLLLILLIQRNRTSDAYLISKTRATTRSSRNLAIRRPIHPTTKQGMLTSLLKPT
jgi:hypothetical protein